MMKKTGPSHAVGYKPSKKQDRYSLESNQCVCADGKGVRETAKSRSKSSLTGPTSLEMLKHRHYTHYRSMREIARCDTNSSYKERPTQPHALWQLSNSIRRPRAQRSVSLNVGKQNVGNCLLRDTRTAGRHRVAITSGRSESTDGKAEKCLGIGGDVGSVVEPHAPQPRTRCG